jgi:hypothetical protein
MKAFAVAAFGLLIHSTFALKIGTGDVCGIDKLSQQSNSRVCVCEVQAKEHSRAAEYPFYKVGCQKWLAQQKCGVRKVVDQGDDISHLFDGETQTLILGYVGHWSSSRATINYVKNRIEPIVKDHGISVFYDNTACSGASDPIEMVNYLSELDEETGSKIILKANENVSVGEWDTILKPFVKSNAPVTTCKDAIQVQSCRRFENKSCSLFLNHRDTMGCLDTGGVFKVLRCEKKRDNQRIKRLSTGRWRELDMNPGAVKAMVTSAREILEDKHNGGFEGRIELNYNVAHTYEYDGEEITENFNEYFTEYSFITWDDFDRQDDVDFANELRKRYEGDFLTRIKNSWGEGVEITFEGINILPPGSYYRYNEDINMKFGFVDYGNPNLNRVFSDNPEVINYYKNNFNIISNYYRYGEAYRNNNELGWILRELR